MTCRGEAAVGSLRPDPGFRDRMDEPVAGRPGTVLSAVTLGLGAAFYIAVLAWVTTLAAAAGAAAAASFGLVVMWAAGVGGWMAVSRWHAPAPELGVSDELLRRLAGEPRGDE